MKILILSSNNGGGHNSAAKALLEEAKERNIDCVMVDAMIFFSPKRSEWMERIHIGAALHAPYLFNMANRMAMRLEQKIKHKGRVQKRAAEYLKQFVLDNEFDTVIATQVFSAILLTDIKVKIPQNVTACFIATDYCYIPFTAMTNLDVYFLPHKDLIPEYYRQKGERLYLPFGIPVSKQFVRGNSDKDVRTKLKIDPKRKMILVLSGSMGYGDTRAICCRLLEELADFADVYVICGRNKHLFRQLTELSTAYKSLHVIEYENCVGDYVDASDVVLSKPGGLSATEVAVKGKPLIFTKPIPGWEEENIRIFTNRGMALAAKTPRELAQLARGFLIDDYICIQMQQQQRRHVNGFAGRDILDFVENYFVLR